MLASHPLGGTYYLLSTCSLTRIMCGIFSLCPFQYLKNIFQDIRHTAVHVRARASDEFVRAAQAGHDEELRVFLRGEGPRALPRLVSSRSW